MTVAGAKKSLIGQTQLERDEQARAQAWKTSDLGPDTSVHVAPRGTRCAERLSRGWQTTYYYVVRLLPGTKYLSRVSSSLPARPRLSSSSIHRLTHLWRLAVSLHVCFDTTHRTDTSCSVQLVPVWAAYGLYFPTHGPQIIQDVTRRDM